MKRWTMLVLSLVAGLIFSAMVALGAQASEPNCTVDVYGFFNELEFAVQCADLEAGYYNFNFGDGAAVDLWLEPGVTTWTDHDYAYTPGGVTQLFVSLTVGTNIYMVGIVIDNTTPYVTMTPIDPPGGYPTYTPTATPTPTASSTPTVAATATPAPTETSTPTSTPTATATPVVVEPKCEISYTQSHIFGQVFITGHCMNVMDGDYEFFNGDGTNQWVTVSNGELSVKHTFQRVGNFFVVLWVPIGETKYGLGATVVVGKAPLYVIFIPSVSKNSQPEPVVTRSPD